MALIVSLAAFCEIDAMRAVAIAQIERRMIECAERGETNQLSELLKQWPQITAKDEHGSSLLHLAAWNGHDGTVAMLVDFGADVHAKDDAQATPLHDAAWNGHINVAKILVAHNGRINELNSDRRTPLHLAAFKGDKALVEFLIASGSDVTSADKFGHTALHLAADHGNVPTLELLADNIDVNVASFLRRTPLHLACQKGNDACVTALFAHAANLNAMDNHSNTPLRLAIWHGRKEMVELLLNLGVDANGNDGNDETPLLSAAALPNGDIVRLLLEHYAHIVNISAVEKVLSYDVIKSDATLYRSLILSSFIIPQYDRANIAQIRSKIRVSLWCFKKRGLPRDLHYPILLKNETVVTDILIILYELVEKGIKQNRLKQYMLHIPLLFRPVLFQRTLDNTVQQIHQLLEHERYVSFDFDFLEEDELRKNISAYLGF